MDKNNNTNMNLSLNLLGQTCKMCNIADQRSIETFGQDFKRLKTFLNCQVQGYHELKTISVKQARVILHNVIPKKVRKTTKDM